MNAYHELEDLDMQEWEDLCQHQPISSRDMKAILEDIMSEVDRSCLAAYHPSQKKKKDFICSHCQKQYTRKFDLERHMKKHTQEKGYGCDFCPRTFYRKDKLHQHRTICQRKVAYDERVEKQNSRQVIVDDGSVDGNVSADQRWSKASKRFVCTRCNKPFTRKFDLQRHMKMHARGKELQCSICHKTFYRKDKKLEHERCCGKGQMAEDVEGNSMQSTAQVGEGRSSDTETVENDGCESAINGNLKTIHMKPRVNEKYDLSLFLQGKRANVLKNLEKEFKEKRGLKWLITVQVRMVKYRPDGEDEFSMPHFRSNCQRLVNLNELSVQYQECMEKVKESFHSYQREGSGWQLQEVSS